MEVSKRKRHPEGTARLRYLVRMRSPLTRREEQIGSYRDLNVAIKFATAYRERYGVHIWVRDIQAEQTVFELQPKARAARAGAAGGAR